MIDPWIMTNTFVHSQMDTPVERPVEDDLEKTIERIIYKAGMDAWGSDLHACLFSPTPLPVPPPPVLGGPAYRMMKII